MWLRNRNVRPEGSLVTMGQNHERRYFFRAINPDYPDIQVCEVKHKPDIQRFASLPEYEMLDAEDMAALTKGIDTRAAGLPIPPKHMMKDVAQNAKSRRAAMASRLEEGEEEDYGLTSNVTSIKRELGLSSEPEATTQTPLAAETDDDDSMKAAGQGVRVDAFEDDSQEDQQANANVPPPPAAPETYGTKYDGKSRGELRQIIEERTGEKPSPNTTTKHLVKQLVALDKAA